MSVAADRGKAGRGGLRVIVRGVVQGVGFRPFIYRVARGRGLSGWVANSSRGVVIEVEGPPGQIDSFVGAITAEAPPLSRIDDVVSEPLGPRGFDGFEIRKSSVEPEETTLICPDVAVCQDCLREFLDPDDRRYHYPFINCTNCGPRFSIIESTPYDRPATSMSVFEMCPQCRAEYENPMDRRFHAQPNACPVCGPRLRLTGPDGPPAACAELTLGRSYARAPGDIARAYETDPAAAARWLLKRGAIIGVRGLGGFHIAADATNDETVRALREKKNRPAKPFALMCASMDVVREIAEVSPGEEAALTSPWSPIVLLRARRDPSLNVSARIAPNNSYLGVMLPYAPLHHLLFDDGLTVLIMTSANVSGEPIIADIDTARDGLAGITATFLDHDREIVNRSDDSIVFFESGAAMMSRRSRGYAPYPIRLPVEGGPVLACGTELKNTFALLDGGRAFVSQHIGDLANRATLDLYEEMVEKFTRWFHVEPAKVAHDLHPDYLATRFAKRYAAESPYRRLVGVQHHHAHIVSAMIENGVRGPVVGVALDGTGYGTDGAIWGCEFLVAGLDDFERAGHLAYVPLPGGDAAIRHPYRVAMSHMVAAGGAELGERAHDLFPEIPENERGLVLQQILKSVNCIDTSSAGRLFDAVSALLGVCHEITYEAQAAIELESLADPVVSRRYEYGHCETESGLVVDPGPIIRAVVEDMDAGRPRSEIAAAFHNTVVSLASDVAARIAAERNMETVALSGGVFQNRLLLGRTVAALERAGLRVLLNREVPTNDGGVSLGQAVVAAERG